MNRHLTFPATIPVRNTLKLPVWHREEDIPLADDYTHAFTKVTSRYRDLTG